MNELPDCKNCPLFTSTIVLHNLLLWLVMLTYTPAWFGAEPCSCFSFSNFCFTLLFPPRHCIGFLLQTKMSLIVQCVRRELITKSVFWEFTTHLWSISLVCYPLSSVLSLVVESWHLWALIFCFSSEPLNNISLKIHDLDTEYTDLLLGTVTFSFLVELGVTALKNQSLPWRGDAFSTGRTLD